VHKFGGTSVADAGCFRSVAAIVLANLHDAREVQEEEGDDDPSMSSPARLAVVVSAMGGAPKTTDLLLHAVRCAAERNDAQVEETLRQVRDKHMTCLADLFFQEEESSPSSTSTSSTSSYQALREGIEVDLRHIRDILKTVSLMMWPAQRILELVSGYGELWSTQILAHLLNRLVQQQQQQQQHEREEPLSPCRFAYVDARKVITIDEESESGEGMRLAEPEGGSSSSSSGASTPSGGPAGSGVVVWQVSSQKLQQLYQHELDNSNGSGSGSAHQQVVHLVMTGYVAGNTRGVATTLQRDGSDYSASILGRLLRAHKITIWTDVSGVLTADPRRVPLATVVPEISYNEAQGALPLITFAGFALGSARSRGRLRCWRVFDSRPLKSILDLRTVFVA
jgi:bifunctional aspartokinase / homoserine dehydrogenase 1